MEEGEVDDGGEAEVEALLEEDADDTEDASVTPGDSAAWGSVDDGREGEGLEDDGDNGKADSVLPVLSPSPPPPPPPPPSPVLFGRAFSSTVSGSGFSMPLFSSLPMSVLLPVTAMVSVSVPLLLVPVVSVFVPVPVLPPTGSAASGFF